MHWLKRKVFLPVIRSLRRECRNVLHHSKWPEILARSPTTPHSTAFGVAYGRPIDRFYIENFLADEKQKIVGRVLEIGGRDYTHQFGSSAIISSTALSQSVSWFRKSQLVADLRTGTGLPKDFFDTIILTQTLHVLPNPSDALAFLAESLAPNGRVLLTVPGISQLSLYDSQRWGDFYRFTAQGLEETVDRVASLAIERIDTFGNLYAALALLSGLTVEECDVNRLNDRHDEFPVIVAATITNKHMAQSMRISVP